MPTIHRRHRKIGRNEPCPCGRTKEVEVKLFEVQAKTYGMILGKDEPVDTMMTKVPLKYKHCCGNIDNQRMMAAVRRHISRTIYDVMHGPKKVSNLRRIVNLFKREEKA